MTNKSKTPGSKIQVTNKLSILINPKYKEWKKE
jgi:hypothetical protein